MNPNVPMVSIIESILYCYVNYFTIYILMNTLHIDVSHKCIRHIVMREFSALFLQILFAFMCIFVYNETCIVNDLHNMF